MEQTEKPITLGEIRTQLAELAAKFDTLNNAIMTLTQITPTSGWMDIDQLRAHLPGNLPRSTIYKWIKSRGLPHHRIGKLYCFLRPEVDEWVMHGGDTIPNEIKKAIKSHQS